MTVLPDKAILSKVYITEQAVEESSPVVGSSKNIKLGFVNSSTLTNLIILNYFFIFLKKIFSTPIDVLFLSPPDTPLYKKKINKKKLFRLKN